MKNVFVCMRKHFVCIKNLSASIQSIEIHFTERGGSQTKVPQK
jgi:hypothetical protein